ncbi:methyl-accepting chemotaxis sensory transducer [Clostridium saccharobutylicum DSM 13864]|nr:methyl-accepting chemotaxis sensory transducer [Clostridium saccharobutylicum DSM 13864]
MVEKMRNKLILAFLIVAMLIGIVGTSGVLVLRWVNRNTKQIYNDNLKSVEDILLIKENVSGIKSNIEIMIHEKDKTKIEEETKNINDMIEKSTSYISDYQKMQMTLEEEQFWLEFKNDLGIYTQKKQEIIDDINSNMLDEAQQKYLEIQSIEENMGNIFNKIIQINLNSAQVANKNIDSILLRTSNIIIILSSTFFICVILLGVFMSNYVNKLLKKIRDYAERIASFDFSTPIIIETKDEFGQTASDLNKAQENLNKLLKKTLKALKI